MSRAVQSGETLPEQVVRSRTRYYQSLHRQDPTVDEPQPACPEANRDGTDWNDVDLAAYPTGDLCGNPECFGGGER